MGRSFFLSEPFKNFTLGILTPSKKFTFGIQAVTYGEPYVRAGTGYQGDWETKYVTLSLFLCLRRMEISTQPYHQPRQVLPTQTGVCFDSVALFLAA